MVSVVAHLGRREHQASLGAHCHDVGGDPGVPDHRLASLHHQALESIDVPVRLLVQDVAHGGSGCRHRERVPVERPDLVVGSVDDASHDILGPADRAAHHASSERLAQAHDVRSHAVALRRPAG